MEVNAQQQELDKFESSAAAWWETDGVFKTLHVINPLRVEYIASRADLAELVCRVYKGNINCNRAR